MNMSVWNDQGTAPSTKAFTLPSGEVVHVNKMEAQFLPRTGAPISDTYGNKAVLDVDGQPLFAELAILRMLEKQGWHCVWVDTYRRNFRRAMPPNSEELPPPAKAAFDSIVEANAGRRSGSFDVFAWKGNEFLFAEMQAKKLRPHTHDSASLVASRTTDRTAPDIVLHC